MTARLDVYDVRPGGLDAKCDGITFHILLGARAAPTFSMLYSRRIYPTVEGVRNVIRHPGLTNKKIRKLKAEDLVDD